MKPPKNAYSDLQALVMARTMMRVANDRKDHELFADGRDLEKRALHARKQGKAWVYQRPRLKVVK